MTLPVPRLVVAAAATLLVSCGDDDGAGSGAEWVTDIRAAVEAVEDQLGGAGEYFEVTANPQLTNVFVVSGSEAVPYLYVDGNLEPPGPPLPGASGSTFTAEAIDLNEELVLAQVLEELPEATVQALSVEGGPAGSVRYVVAVRSDAGGVLDVVVSADGAILEVVPL